MSAGLVFLIIGIMQNQKFSFDINLANILQICYVFAILDYGKTRNFHWTLIWLHFKNHKITHYIGGAQNNKFQNMLIYRLH